MPRFDLIAPLGLCAVTFLAVSQPCRGAEAAGVERSHPQMQVDPDTTFLLQVDEKTGQLEDRTGRFSATVRGGAVIRDPGVGPYLRFGEGTTNGITVSDGGRISFAGGCTLETWLFLEDAGAPGAGGILAAKFGSFGFALKDDRLNNLGMTFPKQQVATTTLRQYTTYPVDGEVFFGAMPIPLGRWVHLAVTYDERMKVIRTWVDGGIDRTRYLAREGEAPMASDPTQPVEFLRGMTDVRVAGIRLSRGARRIGAVPALEAYVQQLPFQDRIAVCVDHLDRDLPLPAEIAVILESPAGPTKLAASLPLDSYDPRQILIDAPSWKGALHTLTVKAYARNQIVFSRSVRIASPRPGGTQRINADRSLSVAGRPVFPLVIYSVFPEDYATVARIGFNVIMPRGPSLVFTGLGGGATPMEDARACLDKAQKQNVFLLVEGNAPFGNLLGVQTLKDHPAVLGWMAFDEPWGTLDKVQESYNVVKLLDPDKPIYCVQNNTTRFAETAEGADILACDPYPIPNVSLRYVADATAAAVRSVAGLKPVWTILDQYGDKRPSAQELRCMAYLAIISGANGLGVYAWDDRPDKKRGWYTREHPDDEAALRSVICELKDLESVLLVPNSEVRTRFDPPNSALHAAVKTANGKAYLFVASDSRKEEEAVLSFDGLSVAEGVSRTGPVGAARLHFKQGKVSIKPPPLYAEVFEIK